MFRLSLLGIFAYYRPTMKSPLYLLAGGLVCTAVGAGLAPFVLIGLIGLFLIIAGCIMVIAAVHNLSATINSADARKDIRTYYHFAGAIILTCAAFAVADLANKAITEGYRHLLSWIFVGLFSFLASLFLALSLRQRAGLGWKPCIIWSIAVLCVSPAGLLVAWSLSSILPNQA